MHTNSSATLSRVIFAILQDIILDIETIDTNVIHAKGLLMIKEETNGSFILDHTELQTVLAALNILISQPAITPGEKLRRMAADNMIHLLKISTKHTVVKDNILTMGEYVCLEGIKHHNRFFTLHTKGHDHTKLATGEVTYKILGYANSVSEAQQLIGVR